MFTCVTEQGAPVDVAQCKGILYDLSESDEGGRPSASLERLNLRVGLTQFARGHEQGSRHRVSPSTRGAAPRALPGASRREDSSDFVRAEVARGRLRSLRS